MDASSLIDPGQKTMGAWSGNEATIAVCGNIGPLIFERSETNAGFVTMGCG